MTKLRKDEFDEVTTKWLPLNKKQVNYELINEFMNAANVNKYKDDKK